MHGVLPTVTLTLLVVVEAGKVPVMVRVKEGLPLKLRTEGLTPLTVRLGVRAEE